MTSTEFQPKPGHGQDAAALFELVVQGRIVRPVEALDDATLRAIAQSAVSADYAALDQIVADWTP